MPEPAYDSPYYFIRELARAYAYGRFDQWLADKPAPPRCTPLIHADQFATRAASVGAIVAGFPGLYDTMVAEGEHLIHQADDRPSLDFVPKVGQ